MASWYTDIRILEVRSGKIMAELLISSAASTHEEVIGDYVKARDRALVMFGEKLR